MREEGGSGAAAPASASASRCVTCMSWRKRRNAKTTTKGTTVTCVAVAMLAVKMSAVVRSRCASLRRADDSIGWYAAMNRTRCVDAAMALREMTRASMA